MVDERYTTRRIALDASPLIYLANLEALEIFRTSGVHPLVPTTVIDETTTPALLYRHPDAAVIRKAVTDGVLEPVQLTAAERQTAASLATQIPTMHRGECEVLALAIERRIPALLVERRARRVALGLGVALSDVFELLFDGTPDDDLLAARIRRLGRLVDMRLADLEALMARIPGRRLQ